MQIELHGTRHLQWNDTLPDGLSAQEVFFGRDESGVGEVQIAVAKATRRPTKSDLEAAWKKRASGIASPVVLTAVLESQVWIFGPNPADAPLGPIAVDKAERQLQTVLEEVDGVAARKKMLAIRNAVDSSGTAGFSNHFLFASHHLKVNVPHRSDWQQATDKASTMRQKKGRELITALGFETELQAGDPNTLVLRSATGSRRAIAVLLDETQQFDRKSAAYQISPVAHGLEVAGREDVPWVIVLRESTLRLYPGTDGIGVGQRGQSETYFELDLTLVDEDFIGLLPLVFSAEALEHGGSAEQILDDSAKYAAELGSKLRDRVYEGVVPPIAIAIAEKLPELGYNIDAEGLKVAYSLTLRILFRLLFQAYGEDTGLLPAGRNEGYDSDSLQFFIRRDANVDPAEYSPTATSIWLELAQIWDAIFNGNERIDVPAYGGSLFDPRTTEGALIERLRLPDAVMGPALQNLLADDTDDGIRGPVDFRSLQVREFGTIYEGLLESSLSVAESDLTVDKNGSYLPAKEDDEVIVKAGRPYFHSASGDRKATGSYYTPKIIVDHLIERSITPTLEAHLAKVRGLVEAGKEKEAATLFWDFRVADLAMGSAHFLVAAVDKIERLMRDFLTVTPVPGVRAELERLSAKARDALKRDIEAANEITDAQLLRRQIARRCIYGLDINELAVELSRLAIWIHTFVPGLPMSSLDHNLVMGNSLTGIGTVDEALDALGLDGLFADFIREPLENARNLLTDFANASEADKSEVAKNAQLIASARDAAQPARNVFDAAVATRIGVVKPASGFNQEEIDAIAARTEVRKELIVLEPAHMPLLFPEVFLRSNPGFDVLIGNPPWEELMVEEPKFWLRVRPGLLGLKPAQLKSEIARLREDRSDLLPELEHAREVVATMRKSLLSGPYPGLGTGDIDLYSAFSWRFWQLLREQGRMAMVAPRSLLNSAGSEVWRKQVLGVSRSELVTLVNRGEWVFVGVDGRYAIALAAIVKAPDTIGEVALAGPFFSEPEFASGRLSLGKISFAVIENASSTASVPNLPSAQSVEVFTQIRNAPRLDARSAIWDFRPVREFDATNDRKTFDSGQKTKNSLTVRGGAGFDLWQSETDEVYAWADLGTVETALQEKRKRQIGLKSSAFYGQSSDWANDASTLPFKHPRIAFRDVTNATNTRTCIAALIAPNTILTNKAPYFFDRIRSPKNESFLLGVLCSIPMDWYARRYVELGMSLNIVNGLPVPTLDELSTISARIMDLSGRLAAVDNRYVEWAAEVGVPVGSVKTEEDKNDIIYELDALVSLLYGLSEEQVEHVFATFHRGWDYQPRLNAVLKHYADWKNKA